jgi:hypothetical protein
VFATSLKLACICLEGHRNVSIANTGDKKSFLFNNLN